MKKNKLLLSALLLGSFMTTAPDMQAQTPAKDWFTPADSLLDLPGLYNLAPVDVNNDDYPDLVALYLPSGAGEMYQTKKPFKVLLNVADTSRLNTSGRKYIDVTPESGINTASDTSGYNANVFTLVDLNNDGNVDMVTAAFYYKIETYPYPNNTCHVFLGDGTGKFTYVPNSGMDVIGLVNARSITALDYDRDGKLDLYISTAFKDYTNNVFDHGYLLKGKGDGTFSDVTAASGLADHLEPDYSASVMDYNNDCYPDIFTAPYCRTGGKVYQNDGNGHFTDVAASVDYDLFKIGNGQHACTFTTTPEDVNNDGYMDLFISEVHGGNNPGEFRSTIAINQGPDHNYSFNIDPALLPATASSHRGDYDGAFLDFENDGLIDLVMAEGGYAPFPNRTYFYHQLADHTWEDATPALGLVIPDMANSGVVEPVDFDLDGDDDVILIHNNIETKFWQNNIGNKNSWVAVKLKPVGDKINKNAIGARIYVYHDGGKMQMRELTAGRGMQAGQQPFILNFGLGSASKVDSIIVRWPDNSCSRTKVDDPGIDKMITVSNDPSGISRLDPEQLVTKAFPNPTQGYLVLQRAGITEQTVALTLTDISGRTIAAPYYKSDSDKLIVNMTTLPDGIYMATLILKDGQVIVKKVVKD